MRITLQAGSNQWTVASEPVDISIPMQFGGPQPNTYGVNPATARAYETGGFVGDTRRDGSCNFEEYTLVPHCNGTHTECVGHIALERISILNELKETLVPATLVSVQPENGKTCSESYPVEWNEGDLVITARSLKLALKNSNSDFYESLVIRTLPNEESKKSRDYMEYPPAFFTLDAMQFIRSIGVRHLLTDLPSVDRLFDEGKLGAHRVYWEVAPGDKNIPVKSHSPATITEMIFVPDELKDGIYLLNLQIAPFVADAAPSRPMLFSLSML